MNIATILRLIREGKEETAVFERMSAQFRNGSLRLTSMPEDNDDQELLAVYYEQLAVRTRSHVQRLEEPLAA